jgi:hypothetical protein
MADDNKKKFGDFVAKIKDVGVARPNLFFAEIPPPPFFVQDSDQSRVDMINLMCQQAELPDMQLSTMVVKDDGLDRHVVVDKHYGSTHMVFLVDQDMVIRKYFDDWIQSVVATKGGTFAYFSEYVVDTITVNQLNAARDIVYSVKYHDIYPVSMASLGLSMSQTGGTHLLQVKFEYRWWESTSATSDANLSNVPDDVSTFLQNESKRNLPGIPQIKSMNANLKNFSSIGNQIDGVLPNGVSFGGQTFNFN